jgi:hypothetical protein
MPNPDHPFSNKFLCAAVAAVIFVAVSYPDVYNKTTWVASNISDNYPTIDGNCPTPSGKFIHSALFFALSYFLMKIGANHGYISMDPKNDGVMARYAFTGTLLFFAIASSDTYKLTGSLVDGIADVNGCPLVKGIVAHALVFMVVLILMMYFPKDC